MILRQPGSSLRWITERPIGEGKPPIGVGTRDNNSEGDIRLTGLDVKENGERWMGMERSEREGRKKV